MSDEKIVSVLCTETVISSLPFFSSPFLSMNRALAFTVGSCADFHLAQPLFEEEYLF